ncbi:sterol desaturase family protein [bacterium]|nr:sterol desaturase family protein [bacterium]
MHSILVNEATIRVTVFIGIFAVIALWEVVAPRRKLLESKRNRWFGNLSIVVVNTLILRLLFPVMAVGLAIIARDKGWGLFNNLQLHWWFNLVLSVVFFDMMIYLQHVMFHSVPLLWRLRRMHHADLDYDVTTGSRFHPVEIILSMLIKMALVLVIGPLPAAVVVFEALLNGTAMFNHGNIRIPKSVDGIIRWLLVTPDMPRVHHSVIPVETNSNYGFNLSWWDRLFGTYRAQPKEGHAGMTIGLDVFRESKYLHPHWLLVQPFLNTKPDNKRSTKKG